LNPDFHTAYSKLHSTTVEDIPGIKRNKKKGESAVMTAGNQQQVPVTKANQQNIFKTQK